MFKDFRVSFIVRFTFSVPLSVTKTRGQEYLGNISSINKCATVSAVLSGTGKASGHPLYQSTNATIYLFPERDVAYGPDKSKDNFWKEYAG